MELTDFVNFLCNPQSSVTTTGNTLKTQCFCTFLPSGQHIYHGNTAFLCHLAQNLRGNNNLLAIGKTSTDITLQQQPVTWWCTHSEYLLPVHADFYCLLILFLMPHSNINVSVIY